MLTVYLRYGAWMHIRTYRRMRGSQPRLHFHFQGQDFKLRWREGLCLLSAMPLLDWRMRRPFLYCNGRLLVQDEQRAACVAAL